MGTKHTPGPWNWYWRVEDGETSCGVVSERGYSVCRAPRYQTKEQWEADARLIAAAPELLEALKAARRFVVSSHDAVGDELEMIDAAIAKATTEAP